MDSEARTAPEAALSRIEPEAAPKPVRSGSRMLIALEEVLTWRDVTLQVGFKNSKYMPHQGKQECARRLRQAACRNGPA